MTALVHEHNASEHMKRGVNEWLLADLLNNFQRPESSTSQEQATEALCHTKPVASLQFSILKDVTVSCATKVSHRSSYVTSFKKDLDDN